MTTHRASAIRFASVAAGVLLIAEPAQAASPGAVDIRPVVDLLQQIADRPSFVAGAFVFAVAAGTLANLLASAIKTGAKALWDRRGRGLP